MNGPRKFTYLYGLLEDNDPTIMTVRVSGASRTPRHQGCVERQNQLVKQIIQKKIEELKMKFPNSNPGWVDVLGPATSAIVKVTNH